MKISRALASVGVLFLIGMAVPAYAEVIVFSTQSSDSTPVDVMDAEVEYSFDAGTNVLTFEVFNNTVAPNGYTLSNLFFNVSDDVTGLSILSNGGFTGATLAANQSAGPYGTYDWALDYGSGNTGITAGNSAVITFAVTGSNLDITDFFSGLDVGGGQDFEAAVAAIHFTRGPNDDSSWGTGAPEGGGSGGEIIPEPGTVALMSLGLLGLAARRFRKA